MRQRLTPDDHARIGAAIRAAESRTSGEIYCAVAHISGNYLLPATAIMAGALLVVSLGAAFVLEALWLTMRLPWFVLLQILSFTTGFVVLWRFPRLAIHLVPRPLQFRRAHDNALRQFLARNVHITSERTGVLVFVSLAERYAEVIADAGINRLVQEDTWNGVVDRLVMEASQGRLVDGFVAAIETIGGVLAAHFPVRPLNPNEIDDHVIEI
jgi:putative membrane protein